MSTPRDEPASESLSKNRFTAQLSAGDGSSAGGARRPSGAEEGEAACRGRRGGGLSAPTKEETQRLSDSCSVSDGNVYLLCLAAGRLGLLGSAALDACFQLLRSLPPGTESTQALIDARLIEPTVVEDVRRSLSAGWPLEKGPGSAPSDNELCGAPASPVRPGEPPRSLSDQFELLDVLGRGVHSIVYRARELRLGRTIALKVLHHESAADDATLERFRREAQAAARIAHPGVVKVLAMGEAEGQHWIAMELVQGPSLAAVLRSSKLLRPRRAFEIAQDVARALAAAHANGICHRDVKPGNILLESVHPADPGGGHARLADFGLARIEEASPITRVGEVLATIDYAAPEQVLGCDVDARADVYALGATLYHTLAGKPPYGGAFTPTAARKLARDDPEPLLSIVPGLSREAAAICEQALRWEPSRRYPTAAAMADDIGRFLQGEAVHARPRSKLDSGRRWLRRHPFRSLAAVLAVIGLVLWAALGVSRRWEEDRRIQLARAQMALRNPLSAIEELRGLLNPSTTRGRQAHAIALDGLSSLGLHGAVRRLLQEPTSAALQAIIGQPFELSLRVAESHRPQPTLPFLLLEASRSGDLAHASRASLELAKLEVSLGGDMEWSDARRRLTLLSTDAELPPIERLEAQERASVLQSLEHGVDAGFVGAVSEHAFADLNGDGKPELATAVGRTIEVWDLSGTGCSLKTRYELPESWALPGETLSTGKLAGADVDRVAPGARSSREELLVFTHGEKRDVHPIQTRFELRALRLDGDKLVPYSRGATSHAFAGGMHPGEKILAGHSPDNDEPELFVAMDSEARGAKTILIERPFDSAAIANGLPAPPGQADGSTEATCIFAADLDGDGLGEIGVGTTAWGGYDLRLYGRDRSLSPPFRLLTSRRVGSVGAATACDLDGDGSMEIIVAIHSYSARNTSVFPDPPHKGELKEGIHLLRYQAHLGLPRLEALASDAFEAGEVERDHEYRCFSLSTGKVSGEPACLAAWWMSRRGEPAVTFLDLYRYSSEAGLRRHRIHWSDHHDRAFGRLADLNGDGVDEVVALLGRGEGPGSRWELKVWGGMSPDAPQTGAESLRETLEAPPTSRAIDWFVERNELSTALEMARGWFARGNRHPAMARRWARTAGRAREWSQVLLALETLGEDTAPVSESAREELEMWAEAAQTGRRLHASAPIAELKEALVELYSPSTPPESAAEGTPLLALASREVRIPAGAALRLRLEVRVERIDFNRHLFLGLIDRRGQQITRPRSLAAAVNLDCVGGSGAQARRARPWWNGSFVETEKISIFEEGDIVKAELELSPRERRARLHVQARGTDHYFEIAADQAPLAAGEYALGVFAESKSPRPDGKPEAVLSQLSLEVQVTR